MSRYKKNVLWLAVAAAAVFALWVLNVEITYERNVRHIPTNFHLWQRAAPQRWKA